MPLSDSAHLVSAGIDIGTTSTHLTVSRLGLSNRSVLNQAPRLAIQTREIIYQSPIYFTPISDDGTIDASAVSQLVAKEYAAGGFTPRDIETGAVIITGETARLRNAAEVTHALAETAGDFVIASAGPNLEGVLAGRGSGAAERSAASGRTICNIDIGGGTANIAVFTGGEPIDTACLAIGGRCLRLSPDRQLVGLSDSGELFLDATAKPFKLGSTVTEEMLDLIGHQLAEALVQYIIHKRPPQISERLLVSDSLTRHYTIDEFWLSGGVAELFASAAADPLQFGDIGQYIANGLKVSFSERSLPVHVPENPIRATVIGAGMHSLQLSGSTVLAAGDSLPLRNIPIVRPFLAEPETAEASRVKERVNAALNHHDLNWTSAPLAIVIDVRTGTDFPALEKWAHALSDAFQDLRGHPPLVLVVKEDVAMALGQLLRKHLAGQPLVVLDGIDSLSGDYLDIGRPVSNGQALPVVVKSLLFSPRNTG